MKVIIFFLSLLLFVCNGISQDLNLPLLISGNVSNSNGGMIPEDDFHFKLFLDKNSDYFLTENSPSCGYDPPTWFAELGNLPVGWDFGDIAVIIIEDFGSNERVIYNWVIDSTAQMANLQTQKIPADELVMNFKMSERGVLRGIPVYFSFNSNLTQVSDINFQIMSQNGKKIYKSNIPTQVFANEYQFVWNGKTDSGANLRSGVYFYFLKFNDEVIHSGLVSLKNE